MLAFLGRGSAFSDENNSAYFKHGNDMILVDCPMSAFRRIKKMDLEGIANIYILVTHTHGDHIGGIAMLIDYEFFVRHTPVTVIAPDRTVEDDLRFYLSRLEGCSDNWYTLTNAGEFSAPWLNAVIPTLHAEQLAGRCFGYSLTVDGTPVVYTGDTHIIEPFLPYLKPGTTLYMEISAHKSGVHLYAPDCLDLIRDLVTKGIRVYLMHLDEEDIISEMTKDTGALLAPTADNITTEDHNMNTTDPILNEIYDISDKLYNEMCSNKENDHATLFKYLTELGKTIVGADRASFWKWDKRNNTLWTQSATGVDKIVIPDNTGLVGKALKLGDVVVTNDPYNDPDFNSAVDKKTGYVTKSVLVLPVADVYGQFIGAFQLINKLNDEDGFDEVEDTHKLSLPALILGIALESETFLEDSHHDKLTKLKNRMGFYSDFSRRFNSYMSPDATKPLSMFICDIDKFKRVNDTYGHNAGDDVLAFMAKLMTEACVDKYYAYRWGGEEFIMIMPDTDLMGAVEVAENLRKTVEAADFPADGQTIHCTVSFGCAVFDKDKTIEENVSTADGHLYTAKETGRNRVIYE
ncbi:diguanylate cyclase (GGDEF) domain-containing protein [Ruminococcaceae bacterium YRB3002]|nr:diguanylate cyclase (GGDEF) domain-containing protein [Ruminococcaceae bacterium YRB3002]